MSPIPQSLLEKLHSECTDPHKAPFGMWINKLFFVVERSKPYLPRDLPFPEQKEAFLWLLERLLREGRVLLEPPPLLVEQEPFYWVIADGYSRNDPPRPAIRVDEKGPYQFKVWDVPIELQIAYIREAFPKNVTRPDDDELHLFWYDGRCPVIGWIHPETGVLWVS